MNREAHEPGPPGAVATALRSAPEPARRAGRRWNLVQRGVMAICVFQLGWALAGLLAEPSLDLGEGAPTATVLWVDFNGVHALSGLLLFGPGVVFATRAAWALAYALAAAAALIVTGLWALASTAPAGVFSFPNNERDAVLHLATGALFGALAAIQLYRDRASA